ncbi:alpha/beta hydrolase [Oribacterium sp. P6A1]|uniref:alpha/beta hydrolase n=1 Tax=Oribacterium sp. P6A1 TaxID=1410612 RepID=UPI0006905A07|nr:alpha/beta hydrolase [Oribacterium sp. P6A1]
MVVDFPAKTQNSVPSPYVIVIPGGAFNRQWGFIEGQAIAARLNNMGYTAFVLYYRVKQEPVLPLAILDMVNAIKDIERNHKSYNIIPGEYMIGGFSAGATLAGEIGSENFGYKVNGIPKPQAIFLGYTAVSMKEFYGIYSSLPDGHPGRESIATFLRRVGGPCFTEETLAPFALPSHIGSDFPKTYIVANEDDGTVPVSNSRLMDRCLTGLNVPHITKIGTRGGHSFGLGNGLPVEGWLEEAVKFWRES